MCSTGRCGCGKTTKGDKGEPGIQGIPGVDGTDGFANLTPVTKTANYTLRLVDIGANLVQMNLAGANTFTVPPYSTVLPFAPGNYTFVSQYGAGLTTIVAGSGVTIRAIDGILSLPSRYGILMLINIAQDEWLLSNWGNANLTGPVTSIGNATSVTDLAITNAMLAKIVVYSPTFTTNTYTLILTDDGKFLQLSNGGTAGNLEIPLNATVAYPIGTQIIATQTGTGLITIKSTAGAVIRSDGGSTSNRTFDSQYSSVSLIKVATDTWSLAGKLA